MANRTTHPVPDGTTAGQQVGNKSDDGLDVVVVRTYRNGSTGFGWSPVVGVALKTVDGSTFDPAPLVARVSALETAPPSGVTQAQLDAETARIAALESGKASVGSVTAVDGKADNALSRITTAETSLAGKAATATVNTLSVRVDTFDGRLNGIRDQVLLVFGTLTERNAYTDTREGLRATTISGNTWAVYESPSWVAKPKSEVLSRVGSSNVYGTVADQAAVAAHLANDDFEFVYTELAGFEDIV